jgi:hypothetical protein
MKCRRLRKRFGFVISDFREEAAGGLADTTNPFPSINNLLEAGIAIVSQFVHFALWPRSAPDNLTIYL